MKTTETLSIQKAIESKFCAPGYATFFEVGSSTGLERKRYADALAFSLYPSRGLERIGFEFKVSRSDWLCELRSPEKAESIFQFCDRWYVVTLDGIIEPGELPSTWGHMILKAGRLKTVVQAPLLQANEPSREFLAAIMRRNAQAIESAVAENLAPRLKQELELQAIEMANQNKLEQSELHDIREKLETIKAQTGINLLRWQPAEKTVNCLKLAQLLEKDGVGFAVQMLQNDLQKLSEALNGFSASHPEVCTTRQSLKSRKEK